MDLKICFDYLSLTQTCDKRFNNNSQIILKYSIYLNRIKLFAPQKMKFAQQKLKFAQQKRENCPAKNEVCPTKN
uniref:Uncharacterized protein n=1 Tax=Nyssomyia neivai TaxID=330878 RepID=A0A1L8D7V9_9DIPT